VSLDYRGKNIGTWLMDALKDQLNVDHGHSAFRYITVNAYLSAVPFYEKNDLST
jgi:GNAT superfamily N-acetyltransferase